jgi:molecular chaperone GrpE
MNVGTENVELPSAAPPDQASSTEHVQRADLQPPGKMGELAEMRDRWMRAEAEIANVRARAKRDVEDARLYAVQKFATDVVETAENMRRGLDSLPSATVGEPEIITLLRTGFVGIERNFIELLKRHGIDREDPTGTQFDAERHQAISEHGTLDHAPGVVLRAATAAWTLNGRLLRPAMVVVAKPN